MLLYWTRSSTWGKHTAAINLIISMVLFQAYVAIYILIIWSQLDHKSVGDHTILLEVTEHPNWSCTSTHTGAIGSGLLFSYSLYFSYVCMYVYVYSLKYLFHLIYHKRTDLTSQKLLPLNWLKTICAFALSFYQQKLPYVYLIPLQNTLHYLFSLTKEYCEQSVNDQLIQNSKGHNQPNITHFLKSHINFSPIEINGSA